MRGAGGLNYFPEMKTFSVFAGYSLFPIRAVDAMGKMHDGLAVVLAVPDSVPILLGTDMNPALKVSIGDSAT